MVEFLPSRDAPHTVQIPERELDPSSMPVRTADGRVFYAPAAEVWRAVNKTPRWKAVHPAVGLIVRRWADLVADCMPHQTAEFVDQNLRCGMTPWCDLAFITVASELFIALAPAMSFDKRVRDARADVLHAVTIAMSGTDWPAAKAIAVTGYVDEDFFRGVVKAAETTHAARQKLADHFRTAPMFQPL